MTSSSMGRLWEAEADDATGPIHSLTTERLQELACLLEDLDHWQTGLDNACPFQRQVERTVNELREFYRTWIADDYYGGP